MIRELRHTGLVVADMERALKFWCDVLGFELVKKMDESGPFIDAMMGLEGVHVTTAKLAAPDGRMVELLQFHSHPNRERWEGMPYSTGFTHIALTVDNLDVLMPRLEREGVTFPAVPLCSPDGYAKVTYARAPDGILLELVEVLKS